MVSVAYDTTPWPTVIDPYEAALADDGSPCVPRARVEPVAIEFKLRRRSVDLRRPDVG